MPRHTQEEPPSPRRRSLLRGAVGLAAVHLASRPVTAGVGRLTVFAAASLKNALDDIAAAFTAETGTDVALSYAATSALARQIEQGAPADIFIAADLDWMAYLAERQLIAPGSEIQLVGNDIVLVAAAGAAIEIRVEPGFPLAKVLGDGRLAMADVKAVPAGKYGKAALESLDVWASVEAKVAQAENVRAALKLVAAGEAPLGIVYRTDAMAEPAVTIIGTFPPDTHKPIVYPAARVASSGHDASEAFLSYLRSARALDVFTKQGFTTLSPAADG